MERKLYVAYGSNINIEQMRMRCPTAIMIGKAELTDFKLVFRGRKHSAVATIEPHKGGRVPLLVWAIGADDERALDRYEGYVGEGKRNFYDKRIIHFHMGGVPRRAMVYVMRKGYEIGSPSQAYYETILRGYRSVGFPIRKLNDAVRASMEAAEAAEV